MADRFRLPDGSFLTLGRRSAWRRVRHAECRGPLLQLAGRTPRHRGDLDLVRLLRECPDAFLYRFPWPDEDGAELDAIRRRELDRRTAQPLLVPLSVADELPHHEVRVRAERRGGGHPVRFLAPCPNREAVAAGDSPGTLVDVLGESLDPDGAAVTIFECVYCRAPCAIRPAEVEVVRGANLRGAGDELVAVLERLVGYSGERPTHAPAP